jgi:hypothetical protein
MAIEPGTHFLGPDYGTLTVLTQRGGAAAKAGHDLVIEVTKWDAAIRAGETISIELTADGRSLRVVEGTGGITSLGDEEKAGIAQTIDEQVLMGAPIRFVSDRVDAGEAHLAVHGELELVGFRHPIDFELEVDDGRITGSAKLKQTDWRIKPFSALFGTLKVADVVEVAIDARLPYVPAEIPATRSEQDG